MNFVYPNILWALLLLLLPVIIHLFHFRKYKKVYFNNVRLLRTIDEEKSINKKIRNLLVLLSRLGAMTLLILAFAQPFLGWDKEAKGDKKIVGLYIDNSPSMSALSRKSNLLTEAQTYAESIISTYDEGTQFVVLDNSDRLGRTELLGGAEAGEAIRNLPMTLSQNDINQISKVFKTAATGWDRSADLELYIISDFQKSVLSPADELDTTLDIVLVPLAAVENQNLSVDSMWFDSPRALVGDNQALYTAITNHSDESKETSLDIVINQNTVSLGQIELKPNATYIDTSYITVGDDSWQQAELRIRDYPIEFDNTLHFSFRPVSRIKVTSIHDDRLNSFLAASLSNVVFFDHQSQERRRLDYSLFKNQDLIVLDHLESIGSGLLTELRNYLASGGSICILPSMKMTTEGQRDLASLSGISLGAWQNRASQVFSYDEEDFIFRNIFFEEFNGRFDLPAVQGFYTLTSETAHLANLMRLRSGEPYLAKTQSGSGNTYIYASPIDIAVNDLPNYPQFFIPTLYKMGLNKGSAESMFIFGGDEVLLQYPRTVLSKDEVIHLRSADLEYIPFQAERNGYQNIFVGGDEDLIQGNYGIYGGSEMLGSIGVNSTREESALNYSRASELRTLYPKMQILEADTPAILSASIEKSVQGRSWWKYCLFGALVFLVLEVLLLRFWKN